MQLTPDVHQACEHEALLAAALFAAHPIHTEAVAGIVGHAELLASLLFLAALLVYMRVVDGGRTGNGSVGGTASWPLVASAVGLVLAAAFAKETGITAVSNLTIFLLLHAAVNAMDCTVSLTMYVVCAFCI